MNRIKKQLRKNRVIKIDVLKKFNGIIQIYHIECFVVYGLHEFWWKLKSRIIKHILSDTYNYLISNYLNIFA